jgi:hypothetical protein
LGLNSIEAPGRVAEELRGRYEDSKAEVEKKPRKVSRLYRKAPCSSHAEQETPRELSEDNRSHLLSAFLTRIDR